MSRRLSWLCASIVCLLVAATAALAAPTISATRVLTPQIERFGRFELAADIQGDWQNPFDPDQADVSAEFTAPSGKRLSVPGFWCQDYAERLPATKPRQQVDFLKLFINEKDWAQGTKIEFLLDDIALLDEQGREVPFDDMEQGDTPRGTATAAPPVTWSTELVHGGKRSLRLAPTISTDEHWPAVVYSLGSADWTRYRGMVLWVYPRCGTPIAPLRLYLHDKEWGNSLITAWEPGNHTLEANKWNRLEWRWQDQRPPAKLVPQGAPEWRVRFTPAEVGPYRGRLTARDKGGASASEIGSFTVAPSKRPGFVRVSRDDPHYFVFDDGTPFIPIGHDVAWGLPDVRACYPKMKANGENATYFILCPFDLSFEWDTLGTYDLERAARFDRVLDAARDNGIYLKLSFDVHDAWRPSSLWAASPYNAARGGPCVSPNDLYTSDKAWDYYRKRVRYIAARYGYSTNMMAWEPVAELDGATQLGGIEGWGYPRLVGGEQVSAMLAAFLPKLAGYLRTLDPYNRLFTTSFGGDTSDDNHWKLPEVKYTQIHCYDPADPSDTLSKWARDLTARYAKPMMVTEFGWGVNGPAAGVDPEGLNLHNGIWASVLGGAAGGAFNWWWDIIDTWGLYYHFPPLRRFVSGINFPREGFRPADAQVRVPNQGRTMDIGTLIPGQGGFGDVTVADYPVGADGSLGIATRPPMFLLARGRGEKRIAPRFTVDFPRPSTFAVQVQKVAPDARLEISLDGKVLKAIDLPSQNVPGKPSTYDAKWQIWACEYNEAYAIAVPAGRHEIRVENTHPGASWIQVEGYRVTRQEPATLRALGLTGRSAVLAWVHNPESMWYNWYQPTPKPIAGAKLVLRGLPAGQMRVEWLDTWTGKTVRTGAAQTQAGALTLDVPPVARDVAVRLQRVP